MRRPGDGERGVVDGPFDEERLLDALDLDDELLAVGGGTEKVEAGAAVFGGFALALALADLQVGDVEAEDGVERTDQQFFPAGLLKDFSI